MLKSTLVVLLVVLVVVQGRGRGHPPPHHRNHGNHGKQGKHNDRRTVTFEWGKYEYLAVAHHDTVYTAESACKSWGGHLASVHSISENIQIQRHILSQYAWIGLNDVAREGVYRNTDGTKFDFRSYAFGQPNNYRDEDYTIMKDSGQWYDAGPPRKDHPFDDQHGYVCKKLTQDMNVPDNYSCFDTFDHWDISHCQVDGKWGVYNTITSQTIQHNPFCTAAYNTSLSPHMTLPEASSYIMRMTMYNIKGFLNNNDRGHIGLAFNIKNEKSFDYIFFRLLSDKHCYQVGYMAGYHNQMTHIGPCKGVSLGGNEDIIITLKVEGTKVTVTVDNKEIIKYTSHYTSVNKVAALTRNGRYYTDNKIGYKNARLCQEVICRVEIGGVVKNIKVAEKFKPRKCQTCQCMKYGQVTCSCDQQSHIRCKRDEVESYDAECCKSCVPKSGKCLVTGDPHFYTFDKLWHHFQGVCKYVLVKTADFEVHSGNEVRHGIDEVTWTKEVMVEYQGDEYKLGQAHLLSVNDVQKIIPYRKYQSGGEMLDIRRIGTYTVLSLSKDRVTHLRVTWSGYSRVEIEVNGIYKKTTQGLCGTWNDNKKDELTMRDGSVTSDLNEWGTDWKENDDEYCPPPPPPPHVCDDIPDVRAQAEKICTELKSAKFRSCNSLIDPAGYIEACLVDVCTCGGDKDCACSTLGTYAEQCGERGISINWRKAKLCPLPCESGFYFDHCGSECQPSCGDLSPSCDANKCVEGCFCPKGKVMFDNMCINPSECVCSYEGEIRQIGDKWNDDESCTQCECLDRGNVICNKTICKDCPGDQVPVVIDEKKCCPDCVSDWLTVVNDATTRKVQVGERLSMSVEVHLPWNPPKSAYKWLKVGEKDVKNYIISDGGKTITIQDVTLHDEGTFECRVKIKGKTRAVQIRVFVAQSILIPVDEYKTASVLGSVTFGVIVNVRPSPQYKALMWYHEGQALLPPKNTLISAGFERRNITLKQLVKSNAGKYQCVLTQKDGSVHRAFFTLKVIDGGSADTLQPVQRVISAIHGTNPILQVKTPIAGVPPNAFTWSYKGRVINANTNKHYRFTNYKKGLQIIGAVSGDEGLYSVKMIYGKITANVQIRLQITVEEVVITPANSPLNTVVGQNAHFYISFNSRSPILWKNVAWYRLDGSKNRVKALTPPTGRYRTPNNRQQLSILNVAKSDSGFYEVEVTHNGSKVSALVEMKVDENDWTNSVEQ